MGEHPIEGIMNTTMEKIRQMVDVNTIVGEPINAPDGTIIIPVSKVAYGFGSGGSEFPAKNPNSKDLFGGGSGAGITITPVGFLTIHEGNVKMLQIEPFNSSIDRIIELAPDLIEKVTSLFKKDKKDKNKDKDIDIDNIDINVDIQ